MKGAAVRFLPEEQLVHRAVLDGVGRVLRQLYTEGTPSRGRGVGAAVSASETAGQARQDGRQLRSSAVQRVSRRVADAHPMHSGSYVNVGSPTLRMPLRSRSSMSALPSQNFAVETVLAAWVGRIRTPICHFEQLPLNLANCPFFPERLATRDFSRASCHKIDGQLLPARRLLAASSGASQTSFWRP
jgi:hypothetical protein